MRDATQRYYTPGSRDRFVTSENERAFFRDARVLDGVKDVVVRRVKIQPRVAHVNSVGGAIYRRSQTRFSPLRFARSSCVSFVR